MNTLVTCATRNGMDLIVVTMKSQGTGEKGVPIYPDTTNLLNYATENFQKVNISENEANFSIGQGQLFDTGTSIFGSTTPMIEMDTDGYVVLPNSVDFSAASPSLEFVDSPDSDVVAVLRYQFDGQTIGSTDLTLAEPAVQDFQFQKTGEEDEGQAQTEAKPSTRLIKINLRILIYIVSSVAALLLLFVLFKRLSKAYHFDMSFLTRWRRNRADRNSFSNANRKRYKSRKRRKKDNWLK